MEKGLLFASEMLQVAPLSGNCMVQLKYSVFVVTMDAKRVNTLHVSVTKGSIVKAAVWLSLGFWLLLVSERSCVVL